MSFRPFQSGKSENEDKAPNSELQRLALFRGTSQGSSATNNPLKDLRMMGKLKFEQILESIKKTKKDDEDFTVLEELFKKSELQKKHKFTGRELTECLKRLQFKIAKVGDIL